MTHPSLRHARSPLLVRAAVALALAGGLTLGAGPLAQPASAAQAAPPSPAAAGVLSTAAQFIGTPYVWGGTTPAGFDCSGFTRAVLARHGVGLPRTADAQMRATRHVSAAEAAPGDLVFFTSGGRAYHTAIYAGDGRIYDASRSGGSVSHRSLWTTGVVYARVLA